MFEEILDECDSAQCAELLHASVLEDRKVAAAQMAAVARWADLHNADVARTTQQDRFLEGKQVGAEGTPQVLPEAIDELAVLLQCSTVTARNLLRDVLDLRHRLPVNWDAVMGLGLDAWKARKLAAATRVLTPEQAQWVDAQVVTALCDLPFGRAETIFAGKVIAADPAGHRARREADEQKQFVAVGRRAETGLQLMYARGTAGDMARLMAMINHLADLIAAAGSTDSADERRAQALGMLANPAQACLFLARRHDAASERDTATDTANGSASNEGAEPTGEPDEDEPEEGEPHVTAVDLAVQMGRIVATLGGKTVIDRLRPRSILHVHLHQDALTALQNRLPDRAWTDGAGLVARVEEHGPLALDQLKEWLGGDRVTIRPVAYPLDEAAVDDYQVPRPLEEALVVREPYEVFPYGTLPSRRADTDHTRRYQHRRRRSGQEGEEAGDTGADGGCWAPGQTGLHNLGPLARGHHLAKTFGGFVCHQPLPGTYYWRTPTGRWYRVTHDGTRHLGTTTPAVIELMDSPEEKQRSPGERHLGRWVADQAA